MECENCKRKNDLIVRLTCEVKKSRLNKNQYLIVEAIQEVEKLPNVLLTDPSSPSSSSESPGQ